MVVHERARYPISLGPTCTKCSLEPIILCFWYRFEAAFGSKMCAQMFVWDLASSILNTYSFQSHFVCTCLEWYWSAVQNFSLIAKKFTKLWPFLIRKKSHFSFFSKSILAIPMKRGRDTARGTYKKEAPSLGIWPQVTLTLGC